MLYRALRRLTPKARVAIVVVMAIVVAVLTTVGVYRATHPTLTAGASGTKVVLLQELLRDNGRGRYFSAPTDKSFGEVTARALFNWEADNKDRRPDVVKIDGTITVGGQEWELLLSQRAPTAATMNQRCNTAKDKVVACADKASGKLLLFTDGMLRLEADARFGSSEYPTSEGTFRVTRLEERSWSVPYRVVMPFSVYFVGGEAIHYSQQYENKEDGEPAGASAGCVNLKDYEKARWIFNWFQANGGGTVVVYDSRK